MNDLYLLSNQYRKLDLYHLLVLKTLLEECSVSRTAEKLSVSQPAISKSLAKLRDVFEDELFERGKGQLIPTSKALGLSDKLDRVFAQVNDIVKPEPFNPRNFKGQIVLAIIEPLVPILLPKLMAELAVQAPGLSLIVKSLAEGYQRHGEGQADIMISWEISDAMMAIHLTGYERHTITTDTSLMGLVRAQHPLADSSITLETFLQQTHLTPRIGLPRLDLAQWLQVAIDRKDQNRKVALNCNQIDVLLEVLKQTDHLLAGPSSVIRALARRDPELGIIDLSQVAKELELPHLDFTVLTMERFQNSPMHRWLRQKIIQQLRQQLTLAEQVTS